MSAQRGPQFYIGIVFAGIAFLVIVVPFIIQSIIDNPLPIRQSVVKTTQRQTARPALVKPDSVTVLVDVHLLAYPRENTRVSFVMAGTRLEVVKKQRFRIGLMNGLWYRVKSNGEFGWIGEWNTVEGKDNAPVMVK